MENGDYKWIYICFTLIAAFLVLPFIGSLVADFKGMMKQRDKQDEN